MGGGGEKFGDGQQGGGGEGMKAGGGISHQQWVQLTIFNLLKLTGWINSDPVS